MGDRGGFTFREAEGSAALLATSRGTRIAACAAVLDRSGGDYADVHRALAKPHARATEVDLAETLEDVVSFARRKSR